jgi:hypothetical protein
MSRLQWAVFGHPRNRALKTIIGYVPFGRLNDVWAIIPLYDMRDADYDGKVGWGEALFPWVPFIGSTISPIQETQLMAHVAADLNDPGLYQLVQMRALHTGFELADKGFRKFTLGRLVGASIKPALEAFELSEIATYLLKKAYKKTVMNLLGAS